MKSINAPSPRDRLELTLTCIHAAEPAGPVTSLPRKQAKNIVRCSYQHAAIFHCPSVSAFAQSLINMRVVTQVTKGLIYALLIVTSVTAFGDGLNVTISNNTATTLMVTVYDQNTSPVVRVLSRQTINGFASVSVSVALDDSGQGHLSWDAVSTGTDMRTCSQGDAPNLNDGDTVNVSAGSDCGT